MEMCIEGVGSVFKGSIYDIAQPITHFITSLSQLKHYYFSI